MHNVYIRGSVQFRREYCHLSFYMLSILMSCLWLLRKIPYGQKLNTCSTGKKRKRHDGSCPWHSFQISIERSAGFETLVTGSLSAVNPDFHIFETRILRLLRTNSVCYVYQREQAHPTNMILDFTVVRLLLPLPACWVSRHATEILYSPCVKS